MNLMFAADMEFVQNFTPPDFQAKNFTPAISPNFNSFSEWEWRNLHRWEKSYTAASTDGMDKFHLCSDGFEFHDSLVFVITVQCLWKDKSLFWSNNDMTQCLAIGTEMLPFY